MSGEVTEQGAGSSIRAGLGGAVAYFPKDAQTEVDQGSHADHQADLGVEAFEGRKGEKA